MNQPPDSDPVTAVLDQLEYVVVEAEALLPLLTTLPIEILRTRLFDEDSFLERFARLAERDRTYHRPLMSAIAENQQPVISPYEPSADPPQASDVKDVLRFVAATRKELVDQLRSLPESAWNHVGFREEKPVSLTAVAYEIARSDADLLRKLTERLRDARLSDRQ